MILAESPFSLGHGKFQTRACKVAVGNVPVQHVGYTLQRIQCKGRLHRFPVPQCSQKDNLGSAGGQAIAGNRAGIRQHHGVQHRGIAGVPGLGLSNGQDTAAQKQYRQQKDPI